MNQLCRVCGEPAAGFHFGAFTCEGCKSFFGRTYSNLNSISECKNNGECVINKKNRTSCKACRLRKCLLVGMSKSGSRYGRRSNWFKIHCLLQEKQQELQQQQAAVAAASGVGGGGGGAGGGAPCVSPMGVQRDHKANAAGALWGAKSMSEREAGKPFQMEGKSLTPGSPPRQAAPPMPVTVPGYPGDAAASAAAFWAQARGSLLQLPTPHLSGLPVPFLTPPFLHGAGFHPYQHKGFLLPFLPAEPAAACRPPRPAPPAGPRRPAPPPGCGRRSASSGGCSSEGASPAPSPPAPPAPAPAPPGPPPPAASQAPAAAVAAAAAAATALVVETLRSLGPVQERPLDLSLKGATSGCSSRRAASLAGGTSDSDSGADDDDDLESRHFDDEEDDEVFSEEPAPGEDGGDQARLKAAPEAAAVRRTPLDLTTHA
ncbi:hypothetical protein R5R35_005782 [Gryllus longicercus]|uniref:Nuclear receptor domain-containing protein n=1 Tax=Gryllus longicercus TaxID=2509291 RepID=A0AAN9WCR5_9ORTH